MLCRSRIVLYVIAYLTCPELWFWKDSDDCLEKRGEEVEKRWRWAKVAIFLLFGGKPRWTEEERVPHCPPPLPPWRGCPPPHPQPQLTGVCTLGYSSFMCGGVLSKHTVLVFVFCCCYTLLGSPICVLWVCLYSYTLWVYIFYNTKAMPMHRWQRCAAPYRSSSSRLYSSCWNVLDVKSTLLEEIHHISV